MNEKNVEIKAEFTQMWMSFAAEHEEDLTAGDWAHLFSVLTGTALAMGDVEEDKLPDLINGIGTVITQVYVNACEYLNNDTPMQ